MWLFFNCFRIPISIWSSSNSCIIRSLFDYLDGIVARILNAESEFGKHLDSLSDIVTSGVVPGIIVYQLFKLSGNRVTDFNLDLNLEPIINLDIIFSISPIAFVAFIITLGSALRLAKFNTIDYTDEFEGLPTPANALFFASFPVLMEHYYFFESKEYFLNNYTLILLVVSSFTLMNVPFRLFSLRISLRKYDYNIFKILTVALSIPIILIFGIGGFCLIIILYLFLNVLRNLWSLL